MIFGVIGELALIYTHWTPHNTIWGVLQKANVIGILHPDITSIDYTLSLQVTARAVN